MNWKGCWKTKGLNIAMKMPDLGGRRVWQPHRPGSKQEPCVVYKFYNRLLISRLPLRSNISRRWSETFISSSCNNNLSLVISFYCTESGRKGQDDCQIGSGKVLSRRADFRLDGRRRRILEWRNFGLYIVCLNYYHLLPIPSHFFPDGQSLIIVLAEVLDTIQFISCSQAELIYK